MTAPLLARFVKRPTIDQVSLALGNKKDSNKPSNPVCREGLQVPKEPWLFSCADPMLGRYVYIRLLGKEPRVLTICEVEVYVDSKQNILLKWLVQERKFQWKKICQLRSTSYASKWYSREWSGASNMVFFFVAETALLSYSKFLIPDMNGKLEKPSFVRYDHDNVVMKLGKGSTIKVQRQDIIVDLPLKKENLKHGMPVFIPVMYDSYLKNATATCERKDDSEVLNGKFVSEIYAKMKYAINVTNNGKIYHFYIN